VRIAFVTGSLEPGRDGVGDYTRLLAEACRARGHGVAQLAIAEPAEMAAGPGHEPEQARFSAAGLRGGAAQAWLRAFRPEWVSLQFVPYSFDPRGFFARDLAPLSALLREAPRRHVFFHELWIGSHRGASWRHRLAGWRQRRTIRRLLKATAPGCVQTSVGYYRGALARIGQAATVLPLFGNVPLPRETPTAAVLPGVAAGAVVCGMFGALHPAPELPRFLADFAALAQRLGRPAVLAAAGALRTGDGWFRALAEEWRGRIEFRALGRLDAAALAAVFARFDFAVTTVPWVIIGKSGSTVALREHGLQVVVVAEGAPPRFGCDLSGGAAEDDGLLPYFRDGVLPVSVLEKTPRRSRLGDVAERFLAALAAAS
jgi:hypothetical protein